MKKTKAPLPAWRGPDLKKGPSLVDWGQALTETTGVRQDPYLAWADETKFRDVGQVPLETAVILALRVTAEQFANWVDNPLSGLKGWIRVPSVYRKPSHELKGTTFCTAFVKTEFLYKLQWQPDTIEAYEVGLPIASGEEIPFDPGPIKPTERFSKVVVGVIDDAIAFGHDTLLNLSKHTRFSFLWSQDTDGLQNQPSGFGYGRDFAGKTLNGLQVALGSWEAVYEKISIPGTRNRSSHGTAVAGLAVGTAEGLGDEAESAELIGVQLARRSVSDTSGGSLASQILDAARYILQRTDVPRARAGGGTLAKIIINLSFGKMAGPHDGTSILERAIDELVERRGSLFFVLPSGNSHEYRAHAQFDLARDETKQLAWHVLPDDRTPSFLEVWLPDGSADVVVGLTPPGGISSSPAVSVETARYLADPTTNNGLAAVIAPAQNSRGIGGRLVLVAVAPTQSQAGEVAPHGVWTVTLTNRGAPLTAPVHAWVERDDPTLGRPVYGRQSYLVDPDYELLDRTPNPPGDSAASDIKRQGSISGIATGQHTLVAGGYRKSDATVSIYAASATHSEGARASRSPEVATVTEETETLHGLRVVGTFGCDTVRLAGTSMAAANLTRWLAKNVGASTSVAKVREVLKNAIPVSAPTPGDPLRQGVGNLP